MNWVSSFLGRRYWGRTARRSDMMAGDRKISEYPS
jgi:hypothetical protein